MLAYEESLLGTFVHIQWGRMSRMRRDSLSRFTVGAQPGWVTTPGGPTTEVGSRAERPGEGSQRKVETLGLYPTVLILKYEA